jgi:hypothetical protein
VRSIRVKTIGRAIVSALAILAAGHGSARAQQKSTAVVAQEAAAGGCQGVGSGETPGLNLDTAPSRNPNDPAPVPAAPL